MAKVMKMMVRPNIWHAPQGQLNATPERIRHWVNQFRKMREKLGFRLPIAWGHQPDAVPGDPKKAKADAQYYLSKYNAGYVDDMDVDEKTGLLKFKGDIPGAEVDENGNLITWSEMPDGSKRKCAISEVSAAIRDFKDGNGETWGDSIVHVALTPLPVVNQQGGFTATLSTLFGDEGETSFVTLSTVSVEMSSEGPMAEDKEPKETDTEATGDEAEGEGGIEGGEKFQEVLECLKEHGIKLPDDTTPADLVERLYAILPALKHQKDGGEGEDDEDGDEDEGGEYGAENDGGGDAVEENRPILMGLSDDSLTPLERKLLQERQQKKQKSLLGRIDKLAKAGLPVDEVTALRGKVTGYELSLTRETLEPVVQPVEVELSIWEKAQSAFTKQGVRRQLLGKAQAEERPDPKAQSLSEKEIEELAARFSRNGAR